MGENLIGQIHKIPHSFHAPPIYLLLYSFLFIACAEFSKIVELEEELRVVGNNLKSLELSEEKALAREESYEEQIRQLDTRLKEVIIPTPPNVPLLLSSPSRLSFSSNITRFELPANNAINALTFPLMPLFPRRSKQLDSDLVSIRVNLLTMEAHEEKADRREDVFDSLIASIGLRLKEVFTRNSLPRVKNLYVNRVNEPYLCCLALNVV